MHRFFRWLRRWLNRDRGQWQNYHNCKHMDPRKRKHCERMRKMKSKVKTMVIPFIVGVMIGSVVNASANWNDVAMFNSPDRDILKRIAVAVEQIAKNTEKK